MERLKTTTYMGNVERIETEGDSTITWRRSVGGAIYITETDRNHTVQGETDKSFIYKDHLGSTDVITGKTGTIKQSMSFDAWGQRRDAATWDPVADTVKRWFDSSITNDGFTGHEQLDEVGLIHMNGRVYDPKLGRFLQADPFIQAADNTQSYNRYSYLMNNPLNATDPSGFFLDKLWDEIRPFVGAIAGVFLAAYCIPCASSLSGAVWAGAAAGAVGAAANGGNFFRGAFTGAIGGGLFYGVGQAFDGSSGFLAEGAPAI